MRKIVMLASLTVLVMVGGCAKPVQKEWSATGGSRSGATVELSYQFIVEEETPVLREEQAAALALKRCQSWGYSCVEAFGGVTYQDFQQRGLWGLATRRHVTKTYQCLD